MHPVRQVGIPYEHVAAEVAAWPVASASALRRRPERLDPALGDEALRGLWRDAERDLVAHFPGFMVDELVAVRDRTWFQTSREPVALHDYLRALAAAHLVPHGDAAVPKFLDGDAGDGREIFGTLGDSRLARSRRAWRWLAFALPEDLLLAALGDRSGGPSSVELLSPSVALLLRDRGYGETHLHVGAGLDFRTLWVSAQAAAARTGFSETAFQSPGAEFDDGRRLASWLVRALLARYLLGAFLATRDGDAKFETYLATTARERIEELPLAGAFATLLGALADLRQGELGGESPALADVATLYGLASGMSTVEIPESLDRLDDVDGLAGFFPAPPQGRATVEMRFLRAAFEYLKQLETAKKKAAEGGSEAVEQADDALFRSLFWQTVRVRSIFYRHVTQRPMTPGLLWFVRFYGRIGAGRKPLNFALQVESAARLGGRGKGLKSLEFRTAPSASTEELTGIFEQIARVRERWRAEAQQENRPELDVELGVILHFTKRRGGEAADGAPRGFWRTTTSDPAKTTGKDANVCGFRHGQFFRTKRTEALALAWVLRAYPLALQHLRGLDLCTDELGVPNWVFAPILKIVRDAADEASRVLRAARDLDVPPPRTTIHAGEDFVHLATGLRGVDEALGQLGLREGDRIGHGVALGVHPQRWANKVGRVAMNVETLLFDLVWEWGWLGEHEGSPLAGRQHVLEHEIAERSRAMFGRRVAAEDLLQLRRDLASPARLEQVRYADLFAPPPAADQDARTRLLQEYLTSREVFDRGHDVVWVETAREAESLAWLQAALRARLASNEITVEVNPTSNLLIGHLDDFSNHPMWRLRPPAPQAGDPPPVGVCVGSDDPLTFNSNLRQEYQCLADALLLGGLGGEAARQWLDATRQCGLDHRFTLGRVSEEPIRSLTGSGVP